MRALSGAPRFPTAPSGALSRALPGNSRLAPLWLAVLIVKIERKLTKICQTLRINLSRPRVAQVKRSQWHQGSQHSQRLRSLSHRRRIISQNSKGIVFQSRLLCFTPSQGLWNLLSCHCHRQDRFCHLTCMVAVQADSGPSSFATSFCPVKSVTTTTVTTTRPITSSSGVEREKPHWNSKLQEEWDIKMFTNNPKLNPKLPSPTSFDGVKPSYVEWSEELLTYLSVTDDQEFVPILQAVTGHKNVITNNVFIEGILSEILAQIKEKISTSKPSLQVLESSMIKMQ